MAIVKGPALSLEASGNLGSINYTRWRGKAVARSVGTYTDPNTADQQTVRGYFTTISQLWSGTLTAAQRQGWKNYARQMKFIDRLGNAWEPDGYRIFMRTNLLLKSTGQTTINDAPVPTVQEQMYELDIVWQASSSRIYWRAEEADGSIVDCYGVQLWRNDVLLPVGRLPIEPDWRILVNGTTYKYGYDNTPNLGEVWHYKARTFDQCGVVGNFFYTSIDCS